jgi:hypothetical protein
VENPNNKPTTLIETEKRYISDIDKEINETFFYFQKETAVPPLGLIGFIWQSAEEALCRCKKNS